MKLSSEEAQIKKEPNGHVILAKIFQLKKKHNKYLGDIFSFINFNLKVMKSLYEIFRNE